jgi:hypothetical protein
MVIAVAVALGFASARATECGRKDELASCTEKKASAKITIPKVFVVNFCIF